MDIAIKKIFNSEKLTRNDYIALKKSYSDHVAKFKPATPLACRECLEVELKFRYKVIESIRNYIKSQRQVSLLVHIDMIYFLIKKGSHISLLLI